MKLTLRLILVFMLLVLAGCANLSPEFRGHHADRLASKAGWKKLRIPTDEFILSAYVPKSNVQADTLTVYIEGDGLVWLSPSQASSDPTPRNPIGLQLALFHPRGAAAYLARPCQYVEGKDVKNCKQEYWTDGRFAIEVINASNQAVGKLMQRVGANNLVLIGYSGGGAVAALVAARRTDVVQLITVAGNLDHRAWTKMHHVLPLDKSLNPADEWESLARIPQRHLVGERDEIVSRAVTDSFVSHFPLKQRPEVRVIPKFDHVCCWVEQWRTLWLTGYD